MELLSREELAAGAESLALERNKVHNPMTAQLLSVGASDDFYKYLFLCFSPIKFYLDIGEEGADYILKITVKPDVAAAPEE